MDDRLFYCAIYTSWFVFRFWVGVQTSIVQIPIVVVIPNLQVFPILDAGIDHG